MKVVPLVEALTKVSELHEPVSLYEACSGEACTLSEEEHMEVSDGTRVHSERLDMVACAVCEEYGASVAYPCLTAQAMGIESIEDHGDFSPTHLPDAQVKFPDFYKVGGVRFDRYPEAVSFQKQHPAMSVEACYYTAEGLRTQPVW